MEGQCSVCNKYFHYVQLYSHLLKCYQKKCFEMEVVLLCTCNSCKAEWPHPGDLVNGGVAGISDSSEVFTATSHKRAADSTHELTTKRQSQQKDNNPSHDINNNNSSEATDSSNPVETTLTQDATRFTYNQLLGKLCGVCELKKNKSARTIPDIQIGMFYLLCYLKLNIFIVQVLSNIVQFSFVKKIILQMKKT